MLLQNRDNNPNIDGLSLPPVLPKEVVRTRPRDFLYLLVCERSFWLEHFFSGDDHVDLIANAQHNELIKQYRTNKAIKLAIDSFNNSSGNSSFGSATWSALGSDGFHNLKGFCGGIATLSPGACIVKSDFSVLQ